MNRNIVGIVTLTYLGLALLARRIIASYFCNFAPDGGSILNQTACHMYRDAGGSLLTIVGATALVAALGLLIRRMLLRREHL